MNEAVAWTDFEPQARRLERPAEVRGRVTFLFPFFLNLTFFVLKRLDLPALEPRTVTVALREERTWTTSPLDLDSAAWSLVLIWREIFGFFGFLAAA